LTPNNHLVSLLEAARRILLFTGAGISTASGIPDYRGPQGVWKRRQPVYYQDFLSSEAARIEYWDFKLEGWAAFRDARPSAVHLAIASLEAARKVELVVTQNIDSLHLLAGTSREKLVELHGTDREIECQSCRRRSEPGPSYEEFAHTRRPPVCASCGGLLKPATISFGQQLRQEDLERALRGATAADLVIALGSTLSVTPAADIPLVAAERGAPYVIVNRGETAHDDLPAVTLRLEGDVTEIFPPAVEKSLGR
jgi:NAD-dependent deacetylase